MAKKTITCEIDQELSIHIASQIVKGLGEFPMEATSTVLNGIAVALMSIAADAAELATEKGMVEKMVLSWFCSGDRVKGTQFSKYIDLEKE